MKLDPSQAVGQIAVDHIQAIAVFERYHIDYSCDSSKSLREACRLADVELADVLEDIQHAPSRPPDGWEGGKDWIHESLAGMVEYIVRIHHTYTRSQLNRIENIIDRMAANQGAQNADMGALQRLFVKMAEETREHLKMEEEVVFPFLVRAEQAFDRGEPIPQPFKDSNFFNHPLRVLMWEHGLLGKEWREIHSLTHHFQPPEDERKLYQPLYEALKALEKDTRRHIHLENNILLKKAVQMGFLNQPGEANGRP